MKPSNTYLLGYYGMKNAGDDALMTAAIAGIKQGNGLANIAISTPDAVAYSNDLIFKPTLSEPQLFKGQNRLQHYYNAWKSQSVVFGGGSVMHNSHDLKIKKQVLKLAGGSNSRAAGVSIGPFIDSSAERHCAELLERLDFIGVRDRESFEIAKSIAPNANCHLTFDLAPALVAHKDFKVSHSPREGVLVNVCPVAKTPNGDFDFREDLLRVNVLAESLIAMWRQTGTKVSIISLNGHSKYGDNELCAALHNMLVGKVPVNFIDYHHNVFDVIKVVSSFKAFISMRLHGNVFAYMTDTPCISLNYHTKCKQWCEQIGLHEDQQFDLTKLKSADLTSILIKGLDQGFDAPTLAINDAVNKSLLNWS